MFIILGLYDSTSKRESRLLHQNGRNMFDCPLMLFLVFVLYSFPYMRIMLTENARNATTTATIQTISNTLQTNTPIKRQSCELPTAGDWTR